MYKIIQTAIAKNQKEFRKNMSHFFLLLIVGITSGLHASSQSPQAIPYQAVARNASGSLITNQNISLRFSIHDATANGTIIYRETQNATTNVLGLFFVNIGQGTPVTGTFASISWGNGAKYTQVEMDAAGGSNYTDMGTQQMMSVPYALYAHSSGSSNVPDGTVPGQTLYWNGTGWVVIPAGQPGQFLQVSAAGVPGWAGPLFSTLSTTAVSAVTYYSSAVSGGNITGDGGSSVTTRGVCWSTTANPTIVNSTTIDGAGTGSFNSTLTNLLPATTYYIRSYATNGAGTAYGNEISFTTVPSALASLTTAPITSVTGGTASGGGTVSAENGTPVTGYGICWSTTPNPTIANNKTTNGAGAGTFPSFMNDLTINTTYYVRAYATNGLGTAYGNQETFTTTAILSIGGGYQGGIIAYILQPGDPGYVAGQTHGLIAAPSDLVAFAPWASIGIIGSLDVAIGSGYTNSYNIFAQDFYGNSAASLCIALNLNGYTGWYLPSKDELNKLYLNKEIIGGFTNYGYWSSSQYANQTNLAWYQYFSDGYQHWFGGGYNSVRAIKSF